MLPTSALNVCSSTPRQTRRTCWIWTWLHGTERQAGAHIADVPFPVKPSTHTQFLRVGEAPGYSRCATRQEHWVSPLQA